MTPDEIAVFEVVVNHEEQYSVWPADRAVPSGWKETGEKGSKDDCLAHIAKVWTDLRPRTARRGQGDS